MKKTKKFLLLMLFLAMLITPNFVSASPVGELSAQLDILMKQLQILREQMMAIQQKTQTQESAIWCHDFDTALKYGDKKEEVTALQTALVKEKLDVSAKESDGLFDTNTSLAVIGFQEKYKEEILNPWDLERGTGYVGETTRKKLNQLYGCEKNKDENKIINKIENINNSLVEQKISVKQKICNLEGLQKTIAYSSPISADKLNQDVQTGDVFCPANYTLVGCVRKGGNGEVVADKNSNNVPQLNLHMDPDQNKCYLGYYTANAFQAGQVGAVCIRSEGLQKTIAYSSPISADKLNQDVQTGDVFCPANYTLVGCVRKGGNGEVVADKNSNNVPQLNLHMDPDQNKCYLGYYTANAFQAGQVGAVCIRSGSSCADECLSGQTRCAGNSQVETCGNYDEDICLEWGNLKSCLFGQICRVKNCVKQEEKTIIIFAHQDDDLLWLLPFWEESVEFVLASLPTTSSHMTVVNQHPDYYKDNWTAVWGQVSIDEFKDFWLDRTLRKTKITYNNIKSKLRPYFSDENLEEVITHNNWGEYGHTHHRLISEVVRDLAVEYGRDVWMLSMVRYDPDTPGLPYINTGDFGLESVTKSFDDSFFKEIRLFYQQEEESPSSQGLNIWSWHNGDGEYPQGNQTFVKVVDNGNDLSKNNSEIQNLMHSVPVFGE